MEDILPLEWKVYSVLLDTMQERCSGTHRPSYSLSLTSLDHTVFLNPMNPFMYLFFSMDAH